MRSSDTADDCRVPQLDMTIQEGWNDTREDLGASAAALRSARLSNLVLENIVPRLALIHEEWRSSGATRSPTAEDIAAFGQAILGADPAASDQFFQRLREQGLSADELFETLLAPTARRLGDLWAEDLIDFVDVTLGVNRLRWLLEIYAEAPPTNGDPRRRALLISTQGEQHVFGLDVVASFLKSSGWDAVVSSGLDVNDHAALVAKGHFAVAGVTISEEIHLPAAARVITAIKRASRNPKIAIMVGGWAVRGRPDLAARVGGDATAEDGPGAALLAQKLYLAQAVGKGRRL